MTERVLNNFRGARALVLHAEDPNRDTLARTLRRLGLYVATVAPEPDLPLAPYFEACDVLFFDADQPPPPGAPDAPIPAVPHIALIGIEAPSRLARIVRHRCSGYLLKPVRPAGVFTALFMAFNEFALRQREAGERAALAERLHGRRHVTKAILRLIETEGIDDDEAFRRLRRESMRRRIPIERIAREITEGHDPEGDRDERRTIRGVQ